MSLWKSLLATWPDTPDLDSDQIHFQLEKLAREALIPRMLAYTQDSTQLKDTRHIVLFRLRALFSQTELTYTAHFSQAFALFDIQQEQAQAACLALLDDPDPMVRGNAIYLLEALFAYECLPEIHKALADKKPFVKQAALHLMQAWQVPVQSEAQTSQTPEARLATLQSHLKDRDGEIRQKAIENTLVLYQTTGYKPAFEQIIQQLKKDRAAYVRQGIATHLGEHANSADFIPALIEAVQQDPKSRSELLWALIRLGERYDVPADVFIKHLQDPEESVVNAAAQGIQLLRFSQGIPALVQALATNNDTFWKVQACAETLASFKTRAAEAAQVLYEQYQAKRQNDDLGFELLKAYAAVSGQEAIPILLNLYKDPHLGSSAKRAVTLGLQTLGWQGEDYIFGQQAF